MNFQPYKEYIDKYLKQVQEHKDDKDALERDILEIMQFGFDNGMQISNSIRMGVFNVNE